jgi:hypothetical protein
LLGVEAEAVVDAIGPEVDGVAAGEELEVVLHAALGEDVV